MLVERPSFEVSPILLRLLFQASRSIHPQIAHPVPADRSSCRCLHWCNRIVSPSVLLWLALNRLTPVQPSAAILEHSKEAARARELEAPANPIARFPRRDA